MSEKKAPVSFLNMGTSSLLVIFLILSISLFATLTLSSAKSDLDFSKQLAGQKQAYYQVCNQSELLIASVDSLVKEQSRISKNAEDYFDKLLISLDNEINSISIQKDKLEKELILSWQIPFTDSKALFVAISIPWEPSQNGNQYYQIISWQTQTIK